MELTGTRVQESPLAGGRVRLVGTVAYDDRAPEEYWFDVHERHASSLSRSGNPWAVALLPLAITLGQPLRLALPVDRLLLENLEELQRIWLCWYPQLRAVPVQAEFLAPREATHPGRNAAFFSGGVDSWFTVLWHAANPGSKKSVVIDDLLSIWGFDVPIGRPEEFGQMRVSLQRAADDIGKELVEVATNLRETRWRQADWAHLSHGAGLASIALALEDRYQRVLVGSSGGYADLSPWASHPLTDHLLSTGATTFVHDGADFDRVAKTGLLATSDAALRSLRVCWKTGGHQNCCACEKCYRTMLALELLGALDRCPTFGHQALDPGDVERIYITPSQRGEYVPLLACAEQRGRPDLAAAIRRAMSRSERLTGFLGVLEGVRQRRLLWRLASPLERAILARRIT